MFTRLTGALTRAVLVMILVASPAVILSDLRMDSQQMVALVALFAGALTFVEYNSVYPGLVEFRDAPPFNRIRFLMLLATVLSLSLIAGAPDDPSTLSELVHAIGSLIGVAMDFPYSPVRLATLMLGDWRQPGPCGSGAHGGGDGLPYLLGFAGRFRGDPVAWPMAPAGGGVQRLGQPADIRPDGGRRCGDAPAAGCPR